MLHVCEYSTKNKISMSMSMALAQTDNTSQGGGPGGKLKSVHLFKKLEKLTFNILILFRSCCYFQEV